MQAHRFNVRVVNVDDLAKEKARVGVPRGKEFQPYDVLLVDKDGNTTVFAHHKK